MEAGRKRTMTILTEFVRRQKISGSTSRKQSGMLRRRARGTITKHPRFEARDKGGRFFGTVDPLANAPGGHWGAQAFSNSMPAVAFFNVRLTSIRDIEAVATSFRLGVTT